MKNKKINNMVKDALKENMTGGTTMSLSTLKGLDTDGDVNLDGTGFLNAASISEAFQSAINSGNISVGITTNCSLSKQAFEKYEFIKRLQMENATADEFDIDFSEYPEDAEEDAADLAMLKGIDADGNEIFKLSTYYYDTLNELAKNADESRLDLLDIFEYADCLENAANNDMSEKLIDIDTFNNYLYYANEAKKYVCSFLGGLA